uniref:tRNA (cytosine(38)-C(5))-methyltransferase n=1 Tax=Alona affinis TaxID=381656 RepID=A0A9N6WSP2_9CRUS|nr:EOG090X0A4V [Alona affinis]
MSETPKRILELYSGIGGMHYASKAAKIGSFEVVFSVDVNNAANEVYRYNFPATNQQARNIVSLTAKEINKLKPDIIMMSPPCQPFTRTGLKLDVEDPRCASFLHLLNIFPLLDTVQYVLMENVVGFETSAMRNAFVETLGRCQFHFREFILTPESLDIPNSRKRYYLIARKPCAFPFGSEDHLLTAFPLDNPLIVSTFGKTLQSYLEISAAADEIRPYLVPERTLSKYCRIMDIRQKCDTSSCCFTKAYSHYAEGTGSVLQSNEHETVQERFSRFETTHDICELVPLGLRYFTPREVANLMEFPDSFNFPPSVSLKTRYRLLGNSLNVLVVSNLLNILMN